VRLVALDMDGTLLDSSSNIRPESAKVIKAAAASGVQVILATGKARPAAIAAARKAHLEGDTLLASHRRPGVFLQVSCCSRRSGR
jgi:hydroxymethylpyrimidine pyrophosphatase-like HAD family hydrolase